MKTNRIALYVVLAVLSLLFAGAGAMKVIGTTEMINNMNAIGYDTNWRLFIGITELLGVVGLWLPRTRALALVLLWPYAVGGLAVHISYGHPFLERQSSAVVASLLIPVALWLDGRFGRLLTLPMA
jgi:DoxX-like family